MKTVLGTFVLLGAFSSILVAYAVPPMERVELSNLEILDIDNPMNVYANNQYVIRADYQPNFPDTKYVILYQITNDDGQVILLNWLEGYQQELTQQSSPLVCGNEICPDEQTHSQYHVCDDELCEEKPHAQKFVETSWTPTVPGTYRIGIFAWEGMDNPSALSPPLRMDVEVEIVK